MNQVVLGASLPFVLAALIYAGRRGRASLSFLVATPIAMALCAIWAVLPDVPRLFGCDRLYFRLAEDPRCDIFFWHYTIDHRESDSSWYVLLFILLVAALLGAAWRELAQRERGM